MFLCKTHNDLEVCPLTVFAEDVNASSKTPWEAQWISTNRCFSYFLCTCFSSSTHHILECQGLKCSAKIHVLLLGLMAWLSTHNPTNVQHYWKSDHLDTGSYYLPLSLACESLFSSQEDLTRGEDVFYFLHRSWVIISIHFSLVAAK